MRDFIFILIFFVTFNDVIYARILKSIQIDFEKHSREKDRQEIIKGTVYFQASGKIVVFVREPVNQWMIYRKDELIIYYPVEKRGFCFTTRFPPYPSFFQAFLGAVKEDYGLTDIGYTLSNHEINADTLTTWWNPPKRLSKQLGNFILVYVSNKITYAESRKSDGSISSKSFYDNHITHGVNYFPLKISTVRYAEADSSLENIFYNNPQFNINLPDIVKNFKLPSDAEIKKIKW
ncbi:MAG: hypothetical protein E3J87_06280 [Candidatus Cloacimonadota bacterium]|nr:MAG: hypothetical protein E3J87_06280 [Candidatus Cloacimonadota bacterium]